MGLQTLSLVLRLNDGNLLLPMQSRVLQLQQCHQQALLTLLDSLLQGTQPAGSQKRQRKWPAWADDVLPTADENEKTIFDDWDDYVKV